MCDLKHIGADGIFRGHAQRHYDFRSGNSIWNLINILAIFP